MNGGFGDFTLMLMRPAHEKGRPRRAAQVVAQNKSLLRTSLCSEKVLRIAISRQFDARGHSRNFPPCAESTAIAAKLKPIAMTAVTANRETHMAHPPRWRGIARGKSGRGNAQSAAAFRRFSWNCNFLLSKKFPPKLTFASHEINHEEMPIEDCTSASSRRRSSSRNSR